MRCLLGICAFFHTVSTVIIDDVITRTRYGSVKGQRMLETYDFGEGTV